MERRIQYLSDRWNEAVAATGGIISAKKSYGQVVKFKSERKNRWHTTRNKDEIEITQFSYQGHFNSSLIIQKTIKIHFPFFSNLISFFIIKEEVFLGLQRIFAIFIH